MFNYGAVISSTLHTGDWDCIPANYRVSPDNGEEYLKRLITFQKKKLQFGIKLNAFVILDDILGHFNFNSRFWVAFITTCRQYYISVFILTQYINKVPPTFRVQISYYFLLKMISEEELVGIREQCFPWLSKKEFREMFQRFTNNRGIIFVDNKTLSNDSKDMYKPLQIPSDVKPFYLSY
jgi:hypothetical protein